MGDFFSSALIRNYAPVIVRQLIIFLGAFMAAKGMDAEYVTWLTSDNTVAMVAGILVAVLAAVWGLIKRPSAKAMETAKAVDAHVPESESVVIQTPKGKPNITIAAKRR